MAEGDYLSDATIMQVLAECVTWTECESMCKERLGLGKVHVDKALREQPSCVDSRKFHLVKQWQQETGKSLTASQLADHLDWVGLHGTQYNRAMELLGLSGRKKNEEHTIYRSSHCVNFVDEIKKVYKNAVTGVTHLPVHPRMTRALSKIMFTNLVVYERKCPGKEEKLDNVFDLFARHSPDSGQSLRAIIEGGPGLGKTTQSKEFVRSLVLDDDNQCQFDLVVFLPLKHYPLDTKIETAIKHELLPKELHKSIKDADIKAFLDNPENKIAFVFDGYDEAPPPGSFSAMNGDITIKDILEGKAYLESCLIVTTRPHKVLDLERNMNVFLKITGFSREQAKQYLQNMLQFVNSVAPGSHLDTSETILQQLEERNLSHMYRNPMLLNMLFHLWDWETQIIADTETGIYTSFVNLKISDEDFDDMIYHLGKVAWSALKKNKLHFTEKAFTKELGKGKKHIFEKGIRTGVLIQEPSLGFNTQSVVFFFHKTLMEYFAAMYLVQVNENGNLDWFTTEFRSLQDFLNYGKVLQFLIGLESEILSLALNVMKDFIVTESQEIIVDAPQKCEPRHEDGKNIVRVYEHDAQQAKWQLNLDPFEDKIQQISNLQGKCILEVPGSDADLQLFHCVLMDNEDFYRSEDLNTHTVTFQLLWQPNGQPSVDFCQQNRSRGIHMLSNLMFKQMQSNPARAYKVIGYYELDAAPVLAASVPLDVEKLFLYRLTFNNHLTFLNSLGTFKDINRLCLFQCRFPDKLIWNTVAELMPKLKLLGVYHCGLNSSEIGHIVDTIPRFKWLDGFGVTGNNLDDVEGRDVLEKMCCFLKDRPSLIELALDMNHLGTWATDNLCDLLKGLKFLKRLRIHDNNLGEGLFEIAKCVSPTTDIHYINNGLGAEQHDKLMQLERERKEQLVSQQ